MTIPLTEYLRILRSMSPEDNPFTVAPEVDPRVGEALARAANGIADFVDLGRVHLPGGYAEARVLLEDVVHTFPSDEHYVDPLAALLSSLAAAPTAVGGVALLERPESAPADDEDDDFDPAEKALRDLIESAFDGTAASSDEVTK